MPYFPAALEKLVEQFARIPGVGRKSAQRMAFFVLSLPEKEAAAFADAILTAKSAIHCCPVCQNLTDSDGPCAICARNDWSITRCLPSPSCAASCRNASPSCALPVTI